MPIDHSIHVVRRNLPRGRFRVALFDFDGTLSLLRSGWQRIMGKLIREKLIGLAADVDAVIERIVVDLNGRPTIVQMQALADVVVQRSGQSSQATDYAAEHQRRLLRQVQSRYDEIHAGRATAKDWTVPGTHAILGRLRNRGTKLILASGTEMYHVRFEAELLQLTPYFGSEIFAPERGDTEFSKRTVIERIMTEHGICGEELLGFGDGVVETEEVRRVGGVAIAIADEQQRARLIRAGADVVIRDYDCQESLLRWLFAEE